MRLFDTGSWPSLTNTSPFGATTTSVGPLKCVGPSPARPDAPSRSSSRPSGANLMT